MNELSSRQIAILERLIASGFSIVGIRKRSCAALLDPVTAGGFRLFGEPCVLLDGNLTVRVRDQAQSWFVWKKQRLEATPARLLELDGFVAELKLLLEP